jgi:PAS domain S-box-containing protein
MPQLVWTTTPEGLHDFFNTRWYHYTGLTPEDSLGLGWKNPFHPDDMPETLKRWSHSLATGEPYVTEYRCRNKDGEWRWFLGRALPFRNKQTGRIEKWFGTCTDVNDGIEAKLSAKRTRQQLLSVIAHSRVTIFAVDVNRRITMLEGALIWDNTGENPEDNSGHRWYIGENVYDVFNRLHPGLPSGERPQFLRPIEQILDGKIAEDTQEHPISDRWYRTRFVPTFVKKTKDVKVLDEVAMDRVIGVIMDVTELKHREAELEEEAREKKQAMENEASANEANRLKSQFLANVSA